MTETMTETPVGAGEMDRLEALAKFCDGAAATCDSNDWPELAARNRERAADLRFSVSRARAAEALEQRVKSLEEGWRPIETAPLDGTEVLVSGPRFNDPAKGQYQAVALYCDGRWVEDEDAPKENHLWEPTHWRPLPQPPVLGAHNAG